MPHFEDRVSPSGLPDALTEHDTTAIVGGPIYGVYVGTGGNIVVKAYDGGGTYTFKDVPQGSVLLLPFGATHLTTATTAADLIGFTR
jgi:hypothetical protein